MTRETGTATCTGLTAMWCPIHGDCCCRDDPDFPPPYGPGDYERCPLHAHSSDHAQGLE